MLLLIKYCSEIMKISNYGREMVEDLKKFTPKMLLLNRVSPINLVLKLLLLSFMGVWNKRLRTWRRYLIRGSGLKIRCVYEEFNFKYIESESGKNSNMMRLFILSYSKLNMKCNLTIPFKWIFIFSGDSTSDNCLRLGLTIIDKPLVQFRPRASLETQLVFIMTNKDRKQLYFLYKKPRLWAEPQGFLNFELLSLILFKYFLIFFSDFLLISGLKIQFLL